MSDSSTSADSLPLVVSLGFAGSREFLSRAPDPDGLHEAVGVHLVKRLGELPRELKLESHHFLCGISQIATGADTLFTKACKELKIAQRIFLPQAREEYLLADGSRAPDFSDEERDAAAELLKSPHIIQERVVTRASGRHDRFEEVNLEIVNSSDVVVCVLREESNDRPGGTRGLLNAAIRRDMHALEIRVGVNDDGSPRYTEQWHHPTDKDGKPLPFVPPALPKEIETATLSSAAATSPSPGVPAGVEEYLNALKKVGSGQANLIRRIFGVQAMVIIGAHMLATLCAVLALLAHHHWALKPLLGVELGLLAIGGGVHLWLHHSHAVRVWAMTRISAEVARSVRPLRNLHVQLGYLFALPFPRVLRSVLRTVNVLHVASTRAQEPTETMIDDYAAERLDGKNRQIEYYTNKLRTAEFRLACSKTAFYVFTAGAFLATACKLGFTPSHAALFGTMAILLPVLAVGALSLAASFDLEARVHTFTDIKSHLDRVRPLFGDGCTDCEFACLALDTEAVLLGETANWASRRSFTSV